MLKITRKVEYALIALSQMQMKGDESLTSVKEISQQNDIPYELLAKTMQLLARAEIVDAVKGPHGGYRLKKDPTKIKMTTFLKSLKAPWVLWIVTLIQIVIKFILVQSEPLSKESMIPSGTCLTIFHSTILRGPYEPFVKT